MLRGIFPFFQFSTVCKGKVYTYFDLHIIYNRRTFSVKNILSGEGSSSRSGSWGREWTRTRVREWARLHASGVQPPRTDKKRWGKLKNKLSKTLNSHTTIFWIVYRTFDLSATSACIKNNSCFARSRYTIMSVSVHTNMYIIKKNPFNTEKSRKKMQ